MLQEQEPLVSIITLNYNQTRVTCEFLESTRTLDYSNYEILVCDMASDEDPTAAILAGNYPNTRILLSKQNLGFAGGNNWGIRQSRGEFIFIVNNDTEVTPGLIHLLLKAFYANANIGVASPKIKYHQFPDTIQYAGFRRLNTLTGRTSTIGEREKDQGQYDESGPTGSAHGCAMMVKRTVLEKTGMFPEIFFLYYEEWDLSARIQQAGFTAWYAAEAVIYHKESITVGKNNPLKTYYLTRNRILYMRRNTGSRNKLIFLLFFTAFTIPKSVIRFVIKRQFTHLKFFIKGVAWNLYHSSRSHV
jgi:GT2 family glycosyltransferase